MRTRIGYDGKELPPLAKGREAYSMELPEPETCGSCAHVTRCLAFGYTASRSRTSCDFSPSRFIKEITDAE